MRKWIVIVLMIILFTPLIGKASAEKPFYKDNPYFQPPDGFKVKEVREFFDEMQRAVSKNDVTWLANHMAYPLRVSHTNHLLIIKDAEEFRRNYKVVIDNIVKNAIACQKFDQLFVNSEGIMVGYGAIWFDQIYLGKVEVSSQMKVGEPIEPVSTTQAKEISASLSDSSKWGFRIIAIDDGISVQDFLKRSCG